MGQRKASRVNRRKGKGRNGRVSLGSNVVGTALVPSGVGTVRTSLRRAQFRDLHDPALGPGTEIAGSELLGYVRVAGTGSSSGYAFSSSPSTTNSTFLCTISPATLGNGQLGLFGTMFSVYRFSSFRIRYVPSVSTATSASVVVGVQFDPGGLYNTAPTIVQTSYLPYVMETPVWQPASVTVGRCPRLFNAYYTDPGDSQTSVDQRDVQQVVAFVFVDNTASATYGKLYMDYRIEFYQRGGSTSNPLQLCLRQFAPRLSSGAVAELQALADDIKTGEISTVDPIAQPVDLRRIAKVTVAQVSGQSGGVMPTDISTVGGLSAITSTGFVPVQGATAGLDVNVKSVALSPGTTGIVGSSITSIPVNVVTAPSGATTRWNGMMPLTCNNSGLTGESDSCRVSQSSSADASRKIDVVDGCCSYTVETSGPTDEKGMPKNWRFVKPPQMRFDPELRTLVAQTQKNIKSGAAAGAATPDDYISVKIDPEDPTLISTLKRPS